MARATLVLDGGQTGASLAGIAGRLQRGLG